MDIEALPFEIAALVLKYSNNPKIVLVSSYFYSLRELYFGSEFNEEILTTYCTAKDLRAVDPRFRDLFSMEHFYLCFEVEFNPPIEKFVFSADSRSPSWKEKCVLPNNPWKYALTCGRWMGRNNKDDSALCVPTPLTVKECKDAFWFGQGEKGHESEAASREKFYQLGKLSVTKEFCPDQGDAPDFVIKMGAFGNPDPVIEEMKRKLNSSGITSLPESQQKTFCYGYFILYKAAADTALNRKSYRNIVARIRKEKELEFLQPGDNPDSPFSVKNDLGNVIKTMFQSD